MVAALIFLLTTQAAYAAPPLGPHLKENERTELRYRLESLSNELELLILNQRSDESGRARLARDSAMLRIPERVPMKPELDSLRDELIHRARLAGLRLIRLEVLSKNKPKRPLPRELFNDTPRFRLDSDDVVETLRLKLTLGGDGPEIEQWIQTWPKDQLRLIEPEQGYARPGLKQVDVGTFALKARAYKFREIRFPKIKPRDPMALLPAWARHDPEWFAVNEPLLWGYVLKIQELIPKTAVPFEKKGNLLLESARMSFFLSKAK
jgi:hypothetical protein